MNVDTHSLLTVFGDDARQRLLELVELEEYGDGTFLFREDDPSDAVFLVLSGEVELTKDASPERRVTIARIVTDDYFGDMGPIDGCGRSTGAVTVGRTRLARLPAGPLLEILRHEPAEASLQFFGRISERLRQANALFAAEVLRKEKLHCIGEMARSIIHDFKSQMAGIECVATLIGNEFGDERIAHGCNLISRQVSQMSSMAQSLLDYAQGRCHLSLSEVSIDDLFQELASVNEDCLQQKDVLLSLAATEDRMRLDRGRIMRTLQNLLTNAVEALAGEAGTVRLEAERLDVDTLELRVSDDGPGIPEEIRPALFEPFVTAGKKQGMGLGTAIARTIVEAHGGNITFVTETGKGTTFSIRLPVV